MFGLFRKKSKPAPEVQIEPAAQASPALAVASFQGPPPSVQQWHGEVAQIRASFAAYLQSAVAESEPLLAEMGSDLSVLESVWGPAERKLEATKQENRHAWNRAKTTFARDKAVDEATTDQADKDNDIAESELELDFLCSHRSVKARAAEALMNHALHTDARTRFCTGCAQPLVSLLIGQAQNVQCPGCGAEQTVEPGQAFRSFAATAALWVGDWDAFEHFREMKRGELEIKSYRKTADVPMDLLHRYHDAAQRCWDTTYGVEAQLVPQSAAHVPRKVEARMKETNKLLRDHWQWREMEES